MIRRTAARTRQGFVAVWHCPNTFACWLRNPYPGWASGHGHVVLVALCGKQGSLLEQKPRTAS
jgi:hypothetical protein